ncbi:hypothetical protein ACWDYK_22405, partial [Streptomyces anthocyanicus]
LAALGGGRRRHDGHRPVRAIRSVEATAFAMLPGAEASVGGPTGRRAAGPPGRRAVASVW